MRHGAAFMGWRPDDREHPLGPKFAGLVGEGIAPGDIVLIARQHYRQAEIVGFGIVQGEHVTILKGFKPPGGQPFGSLRWLRPFVPWSRPPLGVPLIDALRHKAALAQLHPDRDSGHRRVCDWMERQLAKQGKKPGGRLNVVTQDRRSRRALTTKAQRVELVELKENPQLDYTVRTRREVKTAKMAEDKLLHGYRDWLGKQHRKLSAAKYRQLRCDGYETGRNNLIEAKSTIRREHIRMAVGQLLDYAFQGRKKLGDPNMAILLPMKPHPEIEGWLRHLKIALIWREGTTYFDNANGQFA